MENITTTGKIFNIPVYSVRKMVLSGKVPAIRVGRRIFVNVDGFAEYLNSSKLTPEPEPDEVATHSRITPIDLRR